MASVDEISDLVAVNDHQSAAARQVRQKMMDPNWGFKLVTEETGNCDFGSGEWLIPLSELRMDIKLVLDGKCPGVKIGLEIRLKDLQWL